MRRILSNTAQNVRRILGNTAQKVWFSGVIGGVVQARRANMPFDSPGFSAVIVANNGTIARMSTVHPATFVAFKRWLADRAGRDPLKHRWVQACMDKAPENAGLFTEAVGDIARARGMMQLACDTGVTREGLYKALGEQGNPSFATVESHARAGLAVQCGCAVGAGVKLAVSSSEMCMCSY